MPRHTTIEDLFSSLADDDKKAADVRAPSRMKARLYSALIAAQQQTGPLQSLSETRDSGHGLCVFERLVQIAPVGERAKSRFFCWTCHARIVAETVERPPVFWANCPYASFRK